MKAQSPLLVSLMLLMGAQPLFTAEPTGPRRPGDSAARFESLRDTLVLLDEDFTARLASWTVIDHGTPGHAGDDSMWTADNPGARRLALTPPFAIADSDAAGFGEVDTELVSAPMNAAGATALVLRFHHHFKWYPGNWDERADVDVRSSATGRQWVTIASFQGEEAQGSVAYDIKRLAGENLQVRFHYYNANWEWWWAVDDIQILGRRPGQMKGLREGFEGGGFGLLAPPAG